MYMNTNPRELRLVTCTNEGRLTDKVVYYLISQSESR